MNFLTFIVEGTVDMHLRAKAGATFRDTRRETKESMLFQGVVEATCF